VAAAEPGVLPGGEGVGELSPADGGVPEPVARCVARARAETPAAVRDALQAMDDGAFYDAACRLEVAVRLRSPRLCDGSSLSSLRAVCRSRAAMAAAAPDLCPDALGARVRDPVCVAVAARDSGLCAAAGPADRVRCEAIALGDAGRCDRLDPLLREGCAREVAALRGVLPRVNVRSRAAAAPSMATLRCDEDGGATALPWAARGAFLDETGALWALDVAAGWPAPWSLGGDAPLLALRVALRGAREGAEVDAVAVLMLPRLRALRTDDGSLRARARISSAPTARGERARMTVSLEGSSAGARRACAVDLDVFVRDVVPATAFVQDAAR